NCNINNDFEPHILRAHPQIRLVKMTMLEEGALFTLMSGSGASVYGIFENKPDLSMFEESYRVFYDI
ncbi:4-(cytidine 5'-diphospho)-2-C-methyl-D-erythritol kinase, partial [Pseudoxanthomonas sp. SGD-10]